MASDCIYSVWMLLRVKGAAGGSTSVWAGFLNNVFQGFSH